MTECPLGEGAGRKNSPIGVVVIVLLALDEGFDVDRRNNAWLKAQFAKRSADEMRAQAGFHADDAWRQFLKFADQRQPPDLPTQHNLAASIKANEVEYVLADIDTD